VIIVAVRDKPRQIYTSVRTPDRTAHRFRGTVRSIVVAILLIVAFAAIIVIASILA